MSAKAGFTARLGAILNRAAAALSYRFHVAAANLWRDGYNPLRSLTIARAVQLLEDGERGAYADLQWTYRYIEMQDATLGALVERRTSAIQELDWDIKIRAKIPPGKQAIAARQASALENAYNNISNLSAAFEALAMATFRGFARLEKVTDAAGNIIELAPVDQWFWVRSGLYGAWKYNAASTIGTLSGEEVDETRFVCREVARPVNRVALIATVRKGASQKDWDGFIETFGIPAVFVIMPDNIPEGKEDEYLSTAEQITSDARGVLPAGADIKTVDNGARGTNPFKEHLAYQDEQVVLRGTGGKLTMLAESGSGTLAGGAHADTFEAIARAEAREISEILQQAIDAGIIAKVTPGERAYAYFELAANEEMDGNQIIQDIVSLESAGLQTDLEWVEERTGYPLTRTALPQIPAPVQSPDPIRNRGAIAMPAANKSLPAAAKPAGKKTRQYSTRGHAKGFRADQKRGVGGRWVDEGNITAGKGSQARRGVMRDATGEDRKRLGIPPKYINAKVTDDPAADLLATAVNAKGKKVFIYSKAYSESQSAAKFARVGALHKAMPGLQARITADAAGNGPRRDQALALRMAMLTGMRNGGDDGHGKVEAFGISNLRPDHCTVVGDKVYLNFVGKKGVAQNHSFQDAPLAAHIAAQKAAGAPRVFDGNASKTLDYLADISAGQFKVHDIRTWHATVLADTVAQKIAARGSAPTNQQELVAFQKRVSNVVSRQLGNDPAMALKAYIHPAVFTAYVP